MDDSFPVIKNCNFSGNEATAGGGINADCSGDNSLIITNSIFEGNSAKYGGALDVATNQYNTSAVKINNCVVMNNLAINHGGGIRITSGNGCMTNCLVESNISTEGAGISCLSSLWMFTNCTISNNTGYFGGGMYVSSSPTIQNCILWDNIPDAIYLPEPSRYPFVKYSDVQMDIGIYPGLENINADPLFMEGSLGFYYLSHVAAGQEFNSPCISTGNDQAANVCFDQSSGQVCLNALTTRVDGEVDLETVDMGYHFDPSALPNTGDVNGDGNITAGDAQLVFNIVLGLYDPTYLEESAADCNADLSITAGDAQQVFRVVLGFGECADPLV
ncbi:hypothetical protein K8T06_05825 [bacterium]|nr:hypothetical protein [bacterium]